MIELNDLYNSHYIRYSSGFSNFSGVRIPSTGKRFQIEDGIIWNIVDEQNQRCGQAAVYSNCQFI